MKANDTAIMRWWRNWNRFFIACQNKHIFVENSSRRGEGVAHWICLIGHKDYECISDAIHRPEFIKNSKKKYGFRFILKRD